jgi:glycosyltransferase involved in cell wall biosynthesis
MISVVLATYNRANLLPRAIESVRMQTLSEWELIVVDDGSTDQTEGLRSRFTSDKRIRWLRQQNMGLALARNTGMQASHGEFITFIDSDDEFTADHLQQRLEYIAAHPETDLLHGGVQIVGGPDFVRDVNAPEKHIALSDCFIGGTFFLRRRVYQALGGFRPPDYGTDYEFAQRTLQQFCVRKIDVPTYVYHRETPDSLCNLMEKSCG